MIDVNIKVKSSLPDDFYLQWDYIYWWQIRFNLKLMIINAMNEMRVI